MRPETGTMKFDGDWTGVFIRGDNAYLLLQAVTTARKRVAEAEDGATSIERRVRLGVLDGLIQLLADSNEKNGGAEVQHMRPYEECVGGR